MGNDTKLTKLKKLWIYYLLQSALAAGVLFILFMVLGESRIVLISAIGASAFIVFALPKTASAQPKIVIGSHLLGLLAGSLFVFTTLPHFIECPLAAGIAFFLMVALDLEHPPAVGTAISAVINHASFDIWAAVIISTVVLSLVRHIFKDYLKNLV
jgi:CBS-domain-containing membrane protein